MKLFPERSSSQAASAPPIVLVPGEMFFVRRFDLPGGMDPGEVAGFVELQLEELAPFPLEQLLQGHRRAPDGSAVVCYAAYRRRIPSEEQERWQRAVFVLPDFAPALGLQIEGEAVVFLRTPTTLNALKFEAGRALPACIVSRPLEREAPPERVEEVRRIVAERIGAGDVRTLAYRSQAIPKQRAQGLTFLLEPDGDGTAEEVVLPASECWAMDVRDATFVAQQRRRLAFDLMLWRLLQGAAAIVAVLLLGEVLLLGAHGYGRWLSSRVNARQESVAALMDKNSVAAMLDDFGRSRLQPFDMLAVVALLRPTPTVVLTSATAEGVNKLVIDGTAANVAELNAYRAALRSAPEIAEVDNQPPRVTADNRTTFTMNIAFRPEALASPENSVAAAPAERSQP